jgi:hypothetical protein
MWAWIGITFLLVFGWEVIPFLLAAAVVFGPFVAVGMMLWNQHVTKRAIRRRAAAMQQQRPWDQR